ncbi:hypothetical protein [Hwanghaeella sp.]|uniref:hypothetical protein n=1 Tax=Hwanghaeella sp. TaxID=2605943 RepID=UPI003CCBC0DE
MTHADIIALWPSTADLSALLGVSAQVVRKWKMRDSIPCEYWSPIVADAANRGIDGVSLEALARYATEKSGVCAQAA